MCNAKLNPFFELNLFGSSKIKPSPSFFVILDIGLDWKSSGDSSFNISKMENLFSHDFDFLKPRLKQTYFSGKKKSDHKLRNHWIYNEFYHCFYENLHLLKLTYRI